MSFLDAHFIRYVLVGAPVNSRRNSALSSDTAALTMGDPTLEPASAHSRKFPDTVTGEPSKLGRQRSRAASGEAEEVPVKERKEMATATIAVDSIV